MARVKCTCKSGYLYWYDDVPGPVCGECDGKGYIDLPDSDETAELRRRVAALEKQVAAQSSGTPSE